MVREVLEETGLKVEPLRIVAVQGPQALTYKNGHKIQYVAITFVCKIIGGRLHIADDESLELKFFKPDELPDLRPDALERVRCGSSNNPSAFFEPPTA